MIVSFGDKATENLFHGRNTSRALRFPNEIVYHALKKLDILNSATSLQDLRSQPGNHLEALKRRFIKIPQYQDQHKMAIDFSLAGKRFI